MKMSRTAVDTYRTPANGYAAKNAKQPAGSSGTGVGDQGYKPSRLVQMRDDYQRRLMKEKEEKLINMYEENQRRAMDRVERVNRGHFAGTSPTSNEYPNSRLRQPGQMQQQQQQQSAVRPPGQSGSAPSVRDFFRERRNLEARGGYVPPINHHYRQSRAGRLGSGLDRGQPLAPIRQNGTSSAPAAEGNYKNKAQPVQHFSNPPHNFTDDNNNEADDKYIDTNSSSIVPVKAERVRRYGNKKSVSSPKAVKAANPKRSSEQRDEKLSDFQIWQQQQTASREERLKKLNMRAPRGATDGDDDQLDDEEEDEINRKQQELMERIAQQQAELERLKHEREEEEERERQDAETRRKQEAAEREATRRRQREDNRRQREEEAKQRRSEEDRSRQRRELPEGRKLPEEIEDEDDAPLTNSSRFAPHPPTKSTPDSTRHPVKQHRSVPPPKPSKTKRLPTPEEESEPESVPGPGVDIYLKAAEDKDAIGGRVRLAECRVCGRKFAEDRLQRHQDACKNVQKKRKVFDPVQMRTDGTEMAKYIKKGAHKQDPVKKKKQDWRAQHENFVEAIRYAKKMTEMEKQGVALKDLPPPPRSQQPDLVPCPHCGRSFNETAAERHIPRCKDLKTRPPPMRR